VFNKFLQELDSLILKKTAFPKLIYLQIKLIVFKK
jgi:hypothetical protein